VQPTSPSAASLPIATNITAVEEVKEGVYCLTPAAGISFSTLSPVVSPEISYSSSGAVGTIAVNVQHPDCNAAFEVVTYAPADLTKPKTGYAFTIIVP
jgi:hypothetical protein